MAQLLLLHLLAAALAPWLARTWRTKAFPVLALAPATAFVWLLTVATDVREGRLPTQRIPWVPGLGIDLDFRLDTLSWVIALLVTGVGALVLLYCTWYFDDDDPTLWRFTPVFTAFAGAMLGLVLTDNLLMLYVFWELTTVLSYLLIGHNPASSTNRRAAMQALLVTTFGGLAMLVGIIAIGVHHTYSISGAAGGPARRGRRDSGRRRAPARRCPVEVGARAVPFLATRGHGGADPGQRVPARRGDGQGRHLPRRAARPRLRRRPGVACPDARARPADDDRRRLASPAAERHQAPARLRDGEPARLHRRDRGPRHARRPPWPRSRSCSRTASSSPRSSSSSASWTSATGTRDLRRLSGVGRRLLPVRVPASLAGAVDGRRRRRSPASSSKESALESLWADVQDGGAPARGYGWLALAGVVVGSALTAAYTARFLWGAFASKPGVAADAGQGAAPRLRPGAAAARRGLPRCWACSPRSSRRGSCRMPCQFPTGGAPAAARAVARPDRAPRCCRSSPSPSASLLFAP